MINTFDIVRTEATDAGFVELVQHLDADLKVRDGDDHPFYDQFNKIKGLKHVVVIRDGKTAVGCGAIQPLSRHTMEIKRMFVSPEYRGMGLATKILNELESWSKDLRGEKCVLETGVRQPEAIGLYQKNGYVRIPNYGPYSGVENSVCFEKKL